REGEERVFDHVDEAEILLVLLHLSVGGANRGSRRQYLLDLSGQPARRDAGLRLDLNRVEVSHLLEKTLRGRLVEDRESDAAQRDVCRVLGYPGDAELLDRPVDLDADLVADTEMLLVGRPPVDHDLPGPHRPRSEEHTSEL